MIHPMIMSTVAYIIGNILITIQTQRTRSFILTNTAKVHQGTCWSEDRFTTLKNAFGDSTAPILKNDNTDPPLTSTKGGPICDPQ